MTTTQKLSFALNHVLAPALSPAAFFELCRAVGAQGAEIRNDLPEVASLIGKSPAAIGAQARERGIALLTINGLQRFNHWTPEREAEAIALADFAQAAGVAALALVPVNDGSGQADGERRRNLRAALRALKPILSDRDVAGYVEPLGFETCSLRSKREAVEAIDEIDGGSIFGLVHDTFHHHLAGESQLFPELTRIIHISGVTDDDLSVAQMRDGHRVLVNEHDRLGNLAQLRALLARGAAAPISFEPFSPAVQALSDPAGSLAQSMVFICDSLWPEAGDQPLTSGTRQCLVE